MAATDGRLPQTASTTVARQVGGGDGRFYEQGDAVDDAETLRLVELEVRELLSAYEFSGVKSVVRGSDLGALTGAEGRRRAMRCDGGPWKPTSDAGS